MSFGDSEKVSRFTLMCQSLSTVGSGGATLANSGGSLFGPFIDQDVQNMQSQAPMIQLISKTGSYSAVLLATNDYDPNSGRASNFTNISSTFAASGSTIVPLGGAGSALFYGAYQLQVNSLAAGDFLTVFFGR